MLGSNLNHLHKHFHVKRQEIASDHVLIVEITFLNYETRVFSCYGLPSRRKHFYVVFLVFSEELRIVYWSIICYCNRTSFDQRVRNDRVVSQIFLLIQSVLEMSFPRLWELQS